MTDFTDQVKLEGATPSLTNDQVEMGLLVSAGGSGYTSAPSVNITGGEGSGATATASIEGIITGIPITNNGSGYTSASIGFSGSGGAEATPIISNGQIIAIRIDKGGYYSSPPTVTITGNGSGATAQATMSVSDITVTNHGSGYTSDPAVTISAPTGPEISRNTATAYAKRKTNGTVDVFLGTFPKGSSYLTFNDNSFNPEKTADWLLFTTAEAPHSPLLATNEGVVMEKDLMVGGFVDSGQGALLLNYGLLGKPKPASPPCIVLNKSDTPYPSGSTLPSNPENGQLFDHSGNKKIWNGQNWITDNAYTGNYDTLFLFKKDAVTPAHLDLGNLTVHGDVYGSLTLATSNGSINLQVGGWLQWGTSAKLAMTNATRGFSGSTGLATQNGSGDLGIHLTSGLQVDHVDSATGSGIYLFDDLRLWGATTGHKLYDATNNSGSNGQFLQVNASGLPVWTTYSPPAWNGGTVTNNIVINKNAGILKFTGNYPYIEWADSQWGTSAYLQSGVTSVGGAGGNYILFQLPSGKSFGVNTGGSLTLALDSAGNLTPSGALNLAVNKWIQWGTDTRLYQSASGVMKVQQLVNGNWDLGTFDASNIYVDHIAPASGGSLYFLGAPSNLEMNWVNSSPVACRLFFGDGTGWQLNFASGNSSTYSDLFTFLDTGAFCFKTNGQVRLYNSANSVLQVQNSSGGLGTLDVSSLFVDYLNAASQGGTIYLYSSINPASANVYNLGSSGAYYGSIWANYLKYHTEHSAFDSMDDLALVKGYTTKIVTKQNPITMQEYTEKVIDPVSISFLQDENGFYDPSRNIGFLLGCSKALAKKEDEQDDTLTQLFDKIESQQKDIEDLTLRVQKLISNEGASA
jgi:hypothetical protein